MALRRDPHIRIVSLWPRKEYGPEPRGRRTCQILSFQDQIVDGPSPIFQTLRRLIRARVVISGEHKLVILAVCGHKGAPFSHTRIFKKVKLSVREKYLER